MSLLERRDRPSQEELQAAFDLVRDPKDWKNHIDTVIDADKQGIVADAISHFTATSAHFEELPNGKLRVIADGYRMGPAGDH